MTDVLGISAYYHDSAAALVRDGDLVSAAQEERFSRKKHDARFPAAAVRYCLDDAGISVSDLRCVVFYDKPLIKFGRLMATYLAYAPRGFSSFSAAMSVWLGSKLELRRQLRRELASLCRSRGARMPEILFSEHHQSHAASAFFASPYDRAAVLCMDGVGEWATTSVWRGSGNELTNTWQIDFPHSIGLLYSAFTYFSGFKVNSGEYKLMGLAPYGEPRFVDTILEHLIDLKNDGTFRLNMGYFDFPTGFRMTNDAFADLFGGPPRTPESKIGQREMDLSSSIQVVTEEVVLRLARTIHREFDCESLCLAGGVALNCVANGRLLREGPFRNIWIQPAAGDAGGAVGAALAAWHQHFGESRRTDSTDAMNGAFLGPRFTTEQACGVFDEIGAVYRRIGAKERAKSVASLLADGRVVGWFQGRMEFGPRALGGRSILGDPRSPEMQSVMNLKIKYRESFRPFAPAVLHSRVSDWFDLNCASPYMLIVAKVCEKRRLQVRGDDHALFGIDKLKVPRSVIPAVTHVDYSARLQTVHEDTNPHFYALLREFEVLTGCPVLVNTSFNVRGEPIVCSPADAYRCFMRTEMDYLIVEDLILAKHDQPVCTDDGAWRDEFEPD